LVKNYSEIFIKIVKSSPMHFSKYSPYDNILQKWDGILGYNEKTLQK